MPIVTRSLNPDQKPTNEQIKEIQDAHNKAMNNPVYDPDCPPLTEKQLEEVARLAKEKRQKKPVIALRISPATLNTAKALGKGYTGILSRLLDEAIKDPELIKKAL